MIYTEVPSRTQAPLSYFMLLSVLRGRVDAGREAEAGDEDVNLYLSQTLQAAADSQYIAWSQQFIVPHDVDLHERLDATSDLRLQYTTYKLNADHRLLSIGIFDQAHAEALRGKWYYGFATTLNRKLARRRTGIGDVLDKMSAHFDDYAEILGVVRRDYFNFVETLSHRAMLEIETDMRHRHAVALIDRLLDSYAEWLQDGRPAVLAAMHALVDEIRTLEPGFTFDMPRGPAS